ncbi:MAG: hypothetical protein R2822_20205 [Spirosomataceae bacterium]
MALGLVLLLFFHWRGLENTVQWQVLSELDEVAVQLDSLNLSSEQSVVDRIPPNVGMTKEVGMTKSISLLGKAYLLKEQFVPVQSDTPKWLAWGFLAFVLAGWVVLLSAISALSRWWYIAAMAVFIGFMALSHIEILRLFGSENSLGLGVILIVLGGLSYYLHAFREDLPIEKRIFIFTGLMVGLVLLFSFFSKTPFIALTAASYALFPCVVLGVGFAIWLAVEIVASFVYVVTNPKTGFGKNSLLNFLFLSGLFLSGIFLVYLKITRQTDDDFWYVSPFVLYVVSAVLGVWSLSRRTEGLVAFREIGVWLYAGMALIATAAMAFVLFTGNNSLIEVFEDSIIYSQLTIGVVFVAYIALNFWPIFKQGKAVYKIIYKPMRFLQSQAWMIGGMGLIGLLAFNRLHSIDQAQAGNYNALGDLHTASGEPIIADQFYQIALNYDFQNHKSCFALASLALRMGDAQTAGAYYQRALQKDPSPQAYVGLGQTLLHENLFFDAIFNLRKGLQTFPKSGEIQNNLGYLYTKTALADSAYYYFELARQHATLPEVPETNELAFWGKALTLNDGTNATAALGLTKADFTATKLLASRPQSLSHEANRLAVAQLVSEKKQQAQKLTITLPQDSALSVNNFAYLYNYGLYSRDSSLALLFRKLINKTTNGSFYHELHLAEAYTTYGSDKLAALDILAAQTVADTSQKVALARQTLQYWLLKENEFDRTLVDVRNVKTLQEIHQQLQQHPLNEALLQKAIAIFNQQNQPKLAYQALLNALRFRADSPQIQKLYILQCLKMRLTDFAEDNLRDLYALTSPADYQAFLKTYQAQRALIEKERENFQ